MKALIDKVKFNKEASTKFGPMYQFTVYWYDEKEDIQNGSYLSKKQEQNYFEAGKECDFDVTEREYQGNTYYNVKPQKQGNFSPYNKKLKQEQSRYSGFAVSYCKDLIIADKLPLAQWESASKKIFNFMVELDKSIEDDNS